MKDKKVAAMNDYDELIGINATERAAIRWYEMRVDYAQKTLDMALDPRIKEMSAGQFAIIHGVEKPRVQKIREKLGIKGHRKKKYRGPVSHLSAEMRMWR